MRTKLLSLLVSAAIGCGGDSGGSEMQKVSREWFENRFTECGDDHFYAFRSRNGKVWFFQLRDAFYETQLIPVSDVERANGKSEAMAVIPKAKMWRELNPDDETWGDWKEWTELSAYSLRGKAPIFFRGIVAREPDKPYQYITVGSMFSDGDKGKVAVDCGSIPGI